jgi:hypothetical protein
MLDAIGGAVNRRRFVHRMLWNTYQTVQMEDDTEIYGQA